MKLLSEDQQGCSKMVMIQSVIVFKDEVSRGSFRRFRIAVIIYIIIKCSVVLEVHIHQKEYDYWTNHLVRRHKP